LGFSLPNQGHYFNEKTLFSRFTPAGPDHAQVASCAGMVEYFDSIIEHHFGNAELGSNKANVVHDLFRDHETKLLQPLLDYVSAKNSVRLIGPSNAKNRAPTVAIEVQESANDIASKLAQKKYYGCRRRFLW